MSYSTHSLLEIREVLFRAVQPFAAGVSVRRPDEFSEIDDGALYAFRDDREMFVSVAWNVTWGPKSDTYIDEPDDYNSQRRLWVEVPNSLDDHVPEIRDAFRQWFSEAPATKL